MTPQSQSARPDHRVDSASHWVTWHPTAPRLMAGALLHSNLARGPVDGVCGAATALAALPYAKTDGRERHPEGVTAGETAPNSNPPVTAIPRDDERAACASPRTNPRRRQLSHGGA